MKKVIYVIIPEFLATTDTLISELDKIGHKELDTYPGKENDTEILCKCIYKPEPANCITISSLESSGDCIRLDPKQAKKFTKKINEDFPNRYRVCEIFVMASIDKKNTYIYNSGFSLFQEYNKNFIEYFKERCCRKDVYSANNLCDMDADTENFKFFFNYVQAVMNEIEENNEKENGIKIERFREQVQKEFDSFKEEQMKHNPEEMFDEAYVIAKWTEINNCLQAIGKSMHSINTEQMTDYEERHRSFLADLCEFELEYDCNMWNNWDDIIQMIDDFFEDFE